MEPRGKATLVSSGLRSVPLSCEVYRRFAIEFEASCLALCRFVAQPVQQQLTMAFWEYTLAGFNDFLEQRRVAFAEPMPASRVCSICGRLPSGTVLLPCGHVVCEECRREAFEGMECPYDGTAFMEGQCVRLRFELPDLEQMRAVCIVGGKKCATFAGKLCELKDHLRYCRSGPLKCGKCHRSVARDVAVDHYRQCCDGNAPRHSACDARVLQRALEEIPGIKDGLEILRQRVLGERGGDDDLVNEANDLVERLTILDLALSEAQENASGVDREAVSLQSGTKKPVTLGPFRAASKPGVFNTICKFTNVYAARDLLSQNKKEHAIFSELHTLGGYTFFLVCVFLSESVDNEEVNVRFAFFLCCGGWDDYVQWPFWKKVSLAIVHPRDETKDIRLTINMEDYGSAKKPRPGGCNKANFTEETKWNDIELQGYVVKGALYVNVEFE